MRCPQAQCPEVFGAASQRLDSPRPKAIRAWRHQQSIKPFWRWTRSRRQFRRPLNLEIVYHRTRIGRSHMWEFVVLSTRSWVLTDHCACTTTLHTGPPTRAGLFSESSVRKSEAAHAFGHHAFVAEIPNRMAWEIVSSPRRAQLSSFPVPYWQALRAVSFSAGGRDTAPLTETARHSRNPIYWRTEW
jgi:hypothetical protein